MNRRILFYGDSNTWGYRPGGGRIPANRRYTTMVTRQAVDVIPVVDGLNGRCSAWESDIFPPELLGGATLVESLRKANSPDGLAIMLGTNDIMPPLNLSREAITANLRRMVQAARTECAGALDLVIVCPPPLAPAAIENLVQSGEGDRKVLTADLSAPLRDLAAEEDIYFLDGGNIIEHMDAEDGFHLAEVGHLRIGLALGSLLRSLAARRPHMLHYISRRCCS
ncbi:MAG: GDSL-type esterase/lipase family protein [Desulfovibrionaceae bacterium]|nr:GDSL-type esterase/lipase family protein [Desulfovibrionaceae bacterium]